LATWVEPGPDTNHALEQARRELAAQRLRDAARNRSEIYNADWLRGQSAAETAQLGRRGALGPSLRSGWRE
jgi:hypothetical protein